MSWHFFQFVSPGYDGQEVKGEDRVHCEMDGPTLFGAVCDGVSYSYHAAEAADHVSKMARDFTSSTPAAAINSARDWLFAERANAQATSVDVSAFPPEMQAPVEAAARERLKESHQTTLLAFRYEADGTQIRTRCVKCGDSDLLAFDRDGQLLYTTADLRRAPEAGADAATSTGKLMFEHSNRVMHVLPDQADRITPWPVDLVLPPDALLLSTSDGLIDAFDTPADLWAWLRGQTFDDTTDETALAHDLHTRLQGRTGDDDISFVFAWHE